ncbi:MAG: DNA cytosine methyltransferase [Clostridiales bacterium]|nr:DNA cytosine methyltransferase [Clostridiales bacterium]
MSVKAIDLFCGAGGLTCGLQQAGINVVAGIDFDDSCRYAYTYNNRAFFINKKIQDVSGSDLNQLYGEAATKILVGCAPCQPFSTHTLKYKKGKESKTDERWFLINDFLRLILEVKPDIVSMENVPNLSEQDIFLSFVNRLRRAGYSVSFSVVYCPDYGVPQNRHRLVLLASRHGKITIIKPLCEPENYKTVRETIGQLVPIAAGCCSPLDSLHRASSLSALNMQRIQASTPGGTWHKWDESLLCDCHKKDSGKTYASVYSRMEWDKPSPTITTEFYNFGTGRFGHPEQNRAISLREGALLQTFPPDYVFLPEGLLSFKKAGKMIGNAVPVALGKAIGQSIIQHMKGWRDNYG